MNENGLPMIGGRTPKIYSQDHEYWIGDSDSSAELYRDGVWRSNHAYGTDIWPTKQAAIDFIRETASREEPATPATTGEDAPTEPRIYLDCDGVLADFDAAFVAKFGHTPRDYETTNGSDVFWRDIQAESPNFYRELPLMPNARELFDAVKHLRPIILTGCPRGGWAEMQKLAWAAEHFPGTPMIVCRAKDKSQYLHPGDILIDDRTQYRDRWERAGGVFIHHTSAKESLKQLWCHLNTVPASELAALRQQVAELTRECDEARRDLENERWERERYRRMWDDHSLLELETQLAAALAEVERLKACEAGETAHKR